MGSRSRTDSASGIGSQFHRFRRRLGLAPGLEFEHWPLDLDEAERRAAQTLATKSFAAGAEDAQNARAALRSVADGIVDFNLAGVQAGALEGDSSLLATIASAPGRAAAARAQAKEHETESLKLEAAAKAKRNAADAVEVEESQLPQSWRSRRLEVSSSRFSFALGESANSTVIAMVAAVVEGVVLLRPIMESALSIKEPALAALAAVAVSLIAASAALVGGRNLAIHVQDPERGRRSLLGVLGVLVAGIAIGLIAARGESWWVGLAIAATWSSASVIGYDHERRFPGNLLFRRRQSLLGEEANLLARAKAELASADTARKRAQEFDAGAAEATERLKASTPLGGHATSRSSALKEAYKGIVDTEIARGQAARAAAQGRMPVSPRVLRRRAAVGLAGGAAVVGVLALTIHDAGAAPLEAGQESIRCPR